MEKNTVTSTDAKNRLNALLADVERTGETITITNHGRPVARLVPVQPVPRKFGQLPNIVVPKDFDDPLPNSELVRWEGVDES
jgi:prevent-host-death family protein